MKSKQRAERAGRAAGKLRRRGALIRAAILASLLLPCAGQQPPAPAPDPAGIATGDKTAVVDAGGNAFVVAEPTDKNGAGLREEEEGFRRLPGPGGQRAAGGETGRLRRTRSRRHQFRLDAQHRLPGAVHASRLRAAHLRAGAKEERRAPDDAEFRGLRVRVSGVLRGRLRVPVRRRGRQRRAGESRRNADAEPLPAGQRPVGLPGRQGLLPDRPGLRRGQQRLDALRSRVHGDRRLHHRRRDLRADHVLGLPALRTLRRRDLCIRSSAAGSGAAAGCRSSARPCTWATATWISPDPRWCTP